VYEGMFSLTSYPNAKLGTTATDTESAAIIKRVEEAITAHGVAVNTVSYGVPIYIVPEKQATVSVTLRKFLWGNTGMNGHTTTGYTGSPESELEALFAEGVPIPTGAKPAGPWGYVKTTLAAEAKSGQAVLELTSGTGFPSESEYHVMIAGEWLEISKRVGNVVTLKSNLTKAHAAGTAVEWGGEGGVPSGDNHLVIWQPSTGKMWELYHAEYNMHYAVWKGWHKSEVGWDFESYVGEEYCAGWSAERGGVWEDVATAEAVFNASTYPGKSPSSPIWGGPASGLSVGGATARLSEAEAGAFKHAIAFANSWTKKSVYAAPATRTDGQSSETGAMPEGCRLRLPEAFDLEKWESEHPMSALAKMVAVAAQEYGLICRDSGGSDTFTFQFEDPTQYGGNEWISKYQTGGSWSSTFTNFPWSEMEVVKMVLSG
jgi:hypothetical protein